MTEHLVMSSQANTFLQGVLPSAINSVWDRVVPLLERALEYSDTKYNVQDVYEALLKSEMQLWLVCGDNNELCAFCITRILKYPREKRACIVFVSGEDVMRWIHFNEVIQAWAKSEGCESLEIYGRPGWKKLLAPFGYEVIHTVLKVKLPSFH